METMNDARTDSDDREAPDRPQSRRAGDALHHPVPRGPPPRHGFQRQAILPLAAPPAPRIISYFQTHPDPVLLSAFLHFGAAMVLGIFTAGVVRRLRTLGVKGMAPDVALFGGLAAAFDMASASLTQWVLAQPGIAEEASVVRPLYFLLFAHGGPGYSVPLGLLIGGVSIPAGARALLPRWVVALGLELAVVGVLSWSSMLGLGRLTLLIPLTRFPGFLWLIAAGFLLPNPAGDSGH